MGVSGCGKSTVGADLARKFRIQFVDGDSLHPKSNVEKMTKGIPLNDEVCVEKRNSPKSHTVCPRIAFHG